MSIKNIWEFNDDINSLKINNTNIKILDLGCGFGNIFFHFYHEYNISKYLGIEIQSLDKIQSEQSQHYDYQGKLMTPNSLNDYLWKKPENERLYEYYKLVFQTIINERKKESIILNKTSFERIYKNKDYFKFDTKIEDFIESIENDKFDIIVMSKILHYKDIKYPKELIKSAYNFLTNNGILYIQNNKTDKTSRKRKITSKEIESWTEDLFYRLDFGEDGNYSHYLFRKK